MAESPGAGRRACRALHFVPGANERMFQKALALPADALILDLEDAVAPERKDDAREVVAGWLRDADFGRRQRIVRANPLGTPWGERDLELTMRHAPDAYLVPKPEGASTLRALDARLSHWEREYGHPPGSVRVIPIATETARGTLSLLEQADAPRVSGMTWGGEDLSAALGSLRNRGADGRYLEVFRLARCLTLLAAHAGGHEAIDGVWVDIADLDGLRDESREALEMGFTGKISVHPAQIDVINQVFTPSAGDVARAQALVEAFREHAARGVYAFRFEGEMVDAPHLARAQRLLARAGA